MRRGSDERVTMAYDGSSGTAGLYGQLKCQQEAPSTTSASCEVSDVLGCTLLVYFMTNLEPKEEVVPIGKASKTNKEPIDTMRSGDRCQEGIGGLSRKSAKVEIEVVN